MTYIKCREPGCERKRGHEYSDKSEHSDTQGNVWTKRRAVNSDVITDKMPVMTSAHVDALGGWLGMDDDPEMVEDCRLTEEVYQFVRTIVSGSLLTYTPNTHKLVPIDQSEDTVKSRLSRWTANDNS